MPQTPCRDLSLEQRVLRMVAHMDGVRLDREMPVRVPGVCQLCGHPLEVAFIVTHAAAGAGDGAVRQIIHADTPEAATLAALGPDGRGALFGSTGSMAMGVYACDCMTGQVRDLAQARIAERIRARMTQLTPERATSAGSAAQTMRERVRTAKSAPFGRHALSAGVEY